METARFKTAIKYKGQYYKANESFSIQSEDINELQALGATIELAEEQEPDKTNYLEISVTKLKTAISAEMDISLLESLIEQDERTGAKTIYQNRISELNTAQ